MARKDGRLTDRKVFIRLTLAVVIASSTIRTSTEQGPLPLLDLSQQKIASPPRFLAHFLVMPSFLQEDSWMNSYVRCNRGDSRGTSIPSRKPG